MTHDQKLNHILNGLLSRKLKRLAENTDDRRLTFDFLCDILLKNENVDVGEKKFIKNRLIFDEYMTFINIDEVEIPDITQAGIKFMQQGGYVRQKELLNIDYEIKQETLKGLRRGKIAFIFSIISLTIAFLSLLVAFLK
jgi:hypothetical protein